jgi:dimethylamine/trimethylamine dehydrogenase
MASVVAELLAGEGLQVTFVTSASDVAPFTFYTAEQARVHHALLKAGITIVTGHRAIRLTPQEAIIACAETEKQRALPCLGFVPVTSREPNDHLFRTLKDGALQTLIRIGDCKAPGLIAHAIHDGHRAAQEFGAEDSAIAVKRERVII